jgi:hypothetical protein
MTTQSNGERELVLYYTDVDGRFVRILFTAFFGVLAIGCLWLLFQWVTDLPTGSTDLVVPGLFLWPGTLLFCWITVRLAIAAWRSARGHWWLRLTSTGFEVNDRIFGARRYDWQEINRFMLVAPSDQVQTAVVLPGQTFTGALKAGPGQLPMLRVGFQCAPGHRPRLAKLSGDLRGRDGTRADGVVMGYWDRPFNEAVDLMNDWLAGYRTRNPREQL